MVKLTVSLRSERWSEVTPRNVLPSFNVQFDVMFWLGERVVRLSSLACRYCCQRKEGRHSCSISFYDCARHTSVFMTRCASDEGSRRSHIQLNKDVCRWVLRNRGRSICSRSPEGSHVLWTRKVRLTWTMGLISADAVSKERLSIINARADTLLSGRLLRVMRS